jgi:hypothetical protein
VCWKELTTAELALSMHDIDDVVMCEECIRMCDDDHIPVDSEA